jgi:TRAP-type C4-dicarboxylate transport system substrate-binding protein
MFKIVILAFFIISTHLQAAQQVKLAVLVPEGTTWGNSLKKFAKEVDAVTGGEVNFKVYYGGVSGDEPDVLRKVRIGQLHGGIFTGKTLGDINGDVRAMEIPFTFYNNQKKASETLNKLAPQFDSTFKAKGFVNLGFYEIGQVYVVSTKKVSNLNELKGVKIWSWEGDPLVGAMLDSLQLVSVPLALPDVLSSLSTGIINAAYAPPLAILALQWNTKVKYLVDFPTAFSIGALLISDKVWAKIKPDHQQKILFLSKKYVKEANDKSIEESESAKQLLKKSGIEFVSFPEADYKAAAGVRSQVINKLKDKYISSKILQLLEKETR